MGGGRVHVRGPPGLRGAAPHVLPSILLLSALSPFGLRSRVSKPALDNVRLGVARASFLRGQGGKVWEGVGDTHRPA